MAAHPEHDMDIEEQLGATAERVERFRLMHEDALRDLREVVARARAEGLDHSEIDDALRRARSSVGRFSRLTSI